MKFLGHRSAADHFATLEHHRLETAFRQIKCGDQTVVATADDHYFLPKWHLQFPARARELVLISEAPFHSFRITWLAMRPGAAIIPPPGCVADPHMYKFS